MLVKFTVSQLRKDSCPQGKKRSCFSLQEGCSIIFSPHFTQKSSVLQQKENINFLLGDIILIKTPIKTYFSATVSLLCWFVKTFRKVCTAQMHPSKKALSGPTLFFKIQVRKGLLSLKKSAYLSSIVIKCSFTREFCYQLWYSTN